MGLVFINRSLNFHFNTFHVPKLILFGRECPNNMILFNPEWLNGRERERERERDGEKEMGRAACGGGRG